VAGELSEIGIAAPRDLLPALMVGPREIELLTRAIPPHTDDFPTVEYESGRVLNRDGVWYQTFVLLARNLTPFPSAVQGRSLDLAGADRRRRSLLTDHVQWLRAQL